MNNKVTFQCVACCVELNSSGNRLTCPSCNSQTALHDGVPSFTSNDDYFFGEIPSEAMLELAAAVSRNGWEAAFDEMCAHQTKGLRDYIRQYIADASRANWKYLLQLPDEGTVLDFGCGWGETTLSLARSVSRVVSMDLTLERLLLLQARTQDRGLNHVTFAHGGDALPLPFANETFDAVVLNGVLEWVPVTGNGDPRECQLAILRELRRTLKPNGQIYIGIENRVGLKYFLGDIDEHSKLKYTSLFPRWFANRWSRVRTGNDYRTYTYSRRGYAKLLKEAGFEQTDFYCPYPDYREFDQIVPVTSKAVKQLFCPTSAWKRAILKVPALVQLLRWTVPSFSIVASNARPGTTRLDGIVNDVSSRIGLGLEPPAGYHSKPIGEVFAYCTEKGESKPTVLLRIAETQTAIDARLASAKHLKSLWQGSHRDHSCMDVIPRSKGHGFLTDGAFTVEEIKPGVSWRKIADYRKTPDNAVLTVADWLTDFQRESKGQETWEPVDMRAYAAALAGDVQSLLPEADGTLCQADAALEPHAEKDRLKRVPVVPCHGDFHLDNALFSQSDGRLTGIIDWDLGDMRGFPLTDLIYLLLVYGMEVKGQTYSQTVRSMLQPDSLRAAERKVLRDYESAFALDETYREFAIQVTVLQNIITLSARRPEGFIRLKDDLRALPNWIWRYERQRENPGLLATK